MSIEPTKKAIDDYLARITVGGTKHDTGKPDLSLLSPSFIFGLGAVLDFGAKKYAAHNWHKGIALSRPMAAALRHIFAFLSGEDLDPESGLSHVRV